MLELNNVSKHFVVFIERYISKDYNILEFGSSTGHMSFYLCKKGYHIDLLDIRKNPIEEVKPIFQKSNINSKFYVEDFLDHKIKYDFLFNSGLVQCLNYDLQEKFICHAAELSNRLLLFFPERENIIEGNSRIGVAGCKEYCTKNISILCKKYFDTIENNKIDKAVTLSDTNFIVIYGQKISGD